MDWAKVFAETLYVSYSTILRMAIIMIPLLVAIECLKDMGLLEKISDRFRNVARFLKLPGESVLGLIVGFFVGLILGSGVIMQIKEEVKMTRTQTNILFVFIGICHAVIEETIIFTAIGANGAAVFLGRFLTALLFGFMYIWMTSWTAGIKGKQELSIKEGE